MERDKNLVGKLLSLEKIRDYGVAKSIDDFVDDVDFLLQHREVGGSHDLMWKTAYSAPHRFAERFDKRFLVILDEFQHIASYIYPDPHYQTCPIETLAGSFHSLSESKIAPLLVTGSYVGFLVMLISKYLQAGRLKQIRISPYLTKNEGLEAVYKYAEFYNEPINNATAAQINELCMSDPFFISGVIQSEFDDKDLTNSEGVINTVHYEISDRNSEMSNTWNEYLQLTLQRINDKNAKNIWLHLSKDAQRYWTANEIKNDSSFEGWKQPITGQIQGTIWKNGWTPHAIAFRSRKRLALSDFFQNVSDSTRLNIINVKERVHIQREDGKGMEIDIVAKSKCGRVILVEVKKRLEKIPLNTVEDLQEKVAVYEKLFSQQTILPAFLSLGGFTKDAQQFCQAHSIATALEIEHF